MRLVYFQNDTNISVFIRTYKCNMSGWWFRSIFVKKKYLPILNGANELAHFITGSHWRVPFVCMYITVSRRNTWNVLSVDSCDFFEHFLPYSNLLRGTCVRHSRFFRFNSCPSVGTFILIMPRVVGDYPHNTYSYSKHRSDLRGSSWCELSTIVKFIWCHLWLSAAWKFAFYIFKIRPPHMMTPNLSMQFSENMHLLK